MLGDNINSVGWPKCGEIEIMKMVGGTTNGNGDNKTHGTLHWFENGERKYFGNSTTLSSGKFADEFHVFSIIWDKDNIKWYVDDKLFHTQNITSAEMTEFQEKFFLIFNIAVGGNWPGSPDSSTTFPQKMYVDYIRVFQ
jgi:beta-glucanase (GH16 family)